MNKNAEALVDQIAAWYGRMPPDRRAEFMVATIISLAIAELSVTVRESCSVMATRNAAIARLERLLSDLLDGGPLCVGTVGVNAPEEKETIWDRVWLLVNKEEHGNTRVYLIKRVRTAIERLRTTC